jgi:hypothetical protein
MHRDALPRRAAGQRLHNVERTGCEYEPIRQAPRAHVRDRQAAQDGKGAGPDGEQSDVQGRESSEAGTEDPTRAPDLPAAADYLACCVWIDVNIVVNMALMSVLNVAATAPNATAMIPARTAYSIALTPRSSRTKAFMSLRISFSLSDVSKSPAPGWASTDPGPPNAQADRTTDPALPGSVESKGSGNEVIG